MTHSAQVLSDFQVPHEAKVVSAHRTPDFMANYAKDAEVRGLQVIYRRGRRGRPPAGHGGGMDQPSGTSWYDDYKYGLQDLNPFMAAVGAVELSRRFESRLVAYLLGGDDDDPLSPGLDTSCAALLQGEHRLERGEVFGRHLVDRFGEEIRTRHETSIIPGVAHSARRMIQSGCGIYYLFGDSGYRDSCSGVSDEPDLPSPDNLRRTDRADTAP